MCWSSGPRARAKGGFTAAIKGHDEVHRLFAGHAVIANWKMDVAETELPSRLDIGHRSSDADNCLDLQVL
jgi:hypothetical protein